MVSRQPKPRELVLITEQRGLVLGQLPVPSVTVSAQI